MGKDVLLEIRQKIVTLKEVNWSFAAIARHLKFPHYTTARTVWNDYLNNGSLLSKKKAGRPRKLPKRAESLIATKFQKKTPVHLWKRSERIKTTASSVCTKTIRLILKRNQSAGRAASKKILLRQKTRKELKRWCTNYRNLIREDWSGFAFSDECRWNWEVTGVFGFGRLTRNEMRELLLGACQIIADDYTFGERLLSTVSCH